MKEARIPMENNNNKNKNNVTTTTNNNNQHTQTWTTWEELLLTCAVKRHGFNNWDIVSMEVRAKTSHPHHLFTPSNCQQKYRDLKRRFTATKQDHLLEQRDETGEAEAEAEDTGKTGDKVVNIPWLENLRKVRVDELRREVQRYDVSILSLQMKVKRLEEDGERNSESNGKKPDLNNDSRTERPETEKLQTEKSTREKSNSGEDSDRDNRSVNESNSTGSDRKTSGATPGEKEPGTVRIGSIEPVPVFQATGDESFSRDSGVSHSNELDDSETQQSGDIRCSVGLSKRRKRNENLVVGGRGGGGGGGNRIKGDSVKSEPLIRFLEMIRAHQNCSLFERRLQSQESEKYKSLVRQHMDLETIETNVEKGCYSSSTFFLYRDLLLLFNNAIVFFPKTSSESQTAHQLRNIISNEIKKQTQKSDSSRGPSPPNIPKPKPDPERTDSLLAIQKKPSSPPLTVSRKRTSVSINKHSSDQQPGVENQTSSSGPSSGQKSRGGEQSLKDTEKEKPVTGTRSSRRSNGKSHPTKGAVSKGGGSSSGKPEIRKTEAKKTEGLGSDKKRSVVDFLKRIKKNSPEDMVKKTGKGSSEQKKNNGGGGGGGGCKKETGKERSLRSNDEKKVKEEITTSPLKKSSGRPSKKAAEVVVVIGKRGRDGGGGGSAVKEKQQRKKARR